MQPIVPSGNTTLPTLPTGAEAHVAAAMALTALAALLILSAGADRGAS